MLIDRIYQAVKGLVNTDGRGNFDPTNFNLNLNIAINEDFEKNLVVLNQFVNRENRGLLNSGLENLPDRIREKIQHYLKQGNLVYNNGLYTMPNDVRYFDTITDVNDTYFEPCKTMEEFNIIKTVNATSQYPIYIKIGNQIKVAPTSINSSLIVYYLRKPLFPKWTYVVAGNAPQFNPSALDFQDADIHPSAEDDLVIRVCQLFGINLKEPDLQASMQNQQQIENNSTLTS